VEGRAGLAVATAAVLAGEVLAATGSPAPVLLVAAAIGGLIAWRRRAVAASCAVAVLGLAAGVARMDAVMRPVLPPTDVSRLPLPLREVGQVLEVSPPSFRA